MDLDMGQLIPRGPSTQENQFEEMGPGNRLMKKPEANVASTKKLVPLVYQSWAELVALGSTCSEQGCDGRWDEMQVVLINMMLKFFIERLRGGRQYTSHEQQHIS